MIFLIILFFKNSLHSMVEFLQLPEESHLTRIGKVNTKTSISVKANANDWWVYPDSTPLLVSLLAHISSLPAGRRQTQACFFREDKQWRNSKISTWVKKLVYYFTFCHKSLLNARTCIMFPLSSLINFKGNDCSLQKNSVFDFGTKFISFPSHCCFSVI